MTAQIPRLDAEAWEINGQGMTAWINDLEFFEIRPADLYPTGHPLPPGHTLTINHVGLGQSVFLGWHEHMTEAQAAAQRHIGDDE